MFSLSACLATAIFFSSPTTATTLPGSVPLPALADGLFTITQQPNPNYNSSGLNGVAALQYAYNKFGKKIDVSVLAGVFGTVPTSPWPSSYDREYITSVSIGTPAQVLPMDIDTGSSDLYVSSYFSILLLPSYLTLYRWVFSTQTPPAQVAGQKLYNASKSTSSSLLSGQTWSITYGDGSSSSGIVYNDVVTLGSLRVTTEAVEVATTVSSQFTGIAASSGLLGLAFSVLNTVRPTQQKTWFDNLKANLALPLFTANLKKGAIGTYGFGFIDNTSYTGAIGYANISLTRGFWEFASNGYQIGIGTHPFVSTAIDAIADTGTSLLLLPDVITNAYWANVTGAYYEPAYGAYIFPCSSPLPAFVFGVGTYKGVVPGTYMNYGQVNPTFCFGGIQTQGTLPFSIFGDILLKAQYVIFDMGNSTAGVVPRIGWANKL